MCNRAVECFWFDSKNASKHAFCSWHTILGKDTTVLKGGRQISKCSEHLFGFELNPKHYTVQTALSNLDDIIFIHWRIS